MHGIIVRLTTLAAFRTATTRALRMSTSIEGAVPWRDRIEASVAKSRKVRGGNYVQLATVDAANAEPIVIKIHTRHTKAEAESRP